MSQGRTKLSVFRSVGAVYRYLFSFIGSNTPTFFVTFALLFVLNAALGLFGRPDVEPGTVAATVADIKKLLVVFVAAPLLVSSHRFWLTEERSSVRDLVKLLAPRQLRYIRYAVLLFLIIGGIPSGLFFLAKYTLPQVSMIVKIQTVGVLSAVIAVLGPRLFLVYPAIALDEKTGLRVVWRETKKMTWRLWWTFFLIVFPVGFAFGLLVIKTQSFRMGLDDILFPLMFDVIKTFLVLVIYLLGAAFPTVVYQFVREIRSEASPAPPEVAQS